MSLGHFRVARRAQEDLDEIWLYIAHDNLDAADRFVDSLTDRFSLLASSPAIGRDRDDLQPGLRVLPVQNYLIFYRPLDNQIEIARVLHAGRDLKAIF